MTLVLTLPEIRAALTGLDVITQIEEGFAAYSRGEAVVPPVGELLFDDPPGEIHIKYGYLHGGSHAVIKAASGFSRNPGLGLPSGDGLMLLFSRTTGMLDAVLLDEGFLTNIRTAAAGAVVAKFLAPREVSALGVYGAGTQARLQVEYLAGITACRMVYAWGPDEDELKRYQEDLGRKGFRVITTRDASVVPAVSNLIITATPSQTPLIRAEWIRPGTHITALGSDTPEKQELDPAILERADIVAADSLSQSLYRGEIFKARQAGKIHDGRILELGNIILDPALGRSGPEQVTVADLTGVAVQDIRIAEAVFLAAAGQA